MVIPRRQSFAILIKLMISSQYRSKTAGFVSDSSLLHFQTEVFNLLLSQAINGVVIFQSQLVHLSRAIRTLFHVPLRLCFSSYRHARSASFVPSRLRIVVESKISLAIPSRNFSIRKSSMPGILEDLLHCPLSSPPPHSPFSIPHAFNAWIFAAMPLQDVKFHHISLRRRKELAT